MQRQNITIHYITYTNTDNNMHTYRDTDTDPANRYILKPYCHPNFLASKAVKGQCQN